MVQWTHPQQTRALVAARVATFGAARLEVVMEPSGTYGDAARGRCFWALESRCIASVPNGCTMRRSSTTGSRACMWLKAAYLIGRLPLEGVSQPGAEPAASRRALTAHLALLELYQERLQRSRNRLEARLSRHWPEAIRAMDLGSVTLLTVLASHGDAARLAAHAAAAAVLMQRTGRSGLSGETIEQFLDRARPTVGVTCIEAERHAPLACSPGTCGTRTRRDARSRGPWRARYKPTPLWSAGAR
jgi:transposase